MINRDFSNAFTEPKVTFSVLMPKGIMEAVKFDGKKKGMGRDAYLLAILMTHYEMEAKAQQGKLDV